MAKYEMDIEQIATLLSRLKDLSDLIWEHDVEDFLPGGEVGHYDLWCAVDEFADRWDLGINTMNEDLEEIRSRLGGVVGKYAQYCELFKHELEELMVDIRGRSVEQSRELPYPPVPDGNLPISGGEDRLGVAG